MNLFQCLLFLFYYFVFFLYYESKYSDLTYVTSKVDKEKYLVRNRKDKQKAADMLATVKKNLKAIVEYCRKDFSSDPKVQRMVKKYKPNRISESIPNTNYTSYSVNKGEKLVFCIRSKDEKQKLVSINTIMFVAIHELAHVMTKSIGHTTEFWSNMKYLLKRGIEIGLLWNKNMNLLIPIQKSLTNLNFHFGRNFPYSGFHYNYTLDRHSQVGQIDNICLEFRNDLICNEKRINKYTNVFEKILTGFIK